jgi:ABC-type nitrate/sulfonate/bicarbonate transport system permease component
VRPALSPRSRRGLLGLAGCAALIEVLPRAGVVPAHDLPPLTRTLRALWTEASTAAFWNDLGDTLLAWALGLAIAVACGVAAGVLIGSFEPVRRYTASTVEFLRPIPSVALIPLVIVRFGIDLRSTLVLVTYASFWQVLIQVLHGVHDVDPVARETARSYGLGRWAQVRYVTGPTALPYALTGLRLAASVALILTITAGLVIGNPGLGNAIRVARDSDATPTMYAIVLVTGLLGVTVNLLFRSLERRVLRWHTSVRTEVVR